MNYKRNSKYDCKQHHILVYLRSAYFSSWTCESLTQSWHARPECSLDLSQLRWEEIKYDSTNIIVNMSQFIWNRQHFQDATFHHSSSCKCGVIWCLCAQKKNINVNKKINIKVNVHIHVFSNTHSNYPHISWLELKDKGIYVTDTSKKEQYM